MLNVYEELGDASRRLIVCELTHGPKSVTDIVRATGLKQPNVSNHLARLKDRDVVRATRLGRQVFYSLASPGVEAIVQSIFKANRKPSSSMRMDELSRQYAKAAIRGDEAGCFEILEIVCRAGLPLIDIYAGILTPATKLIRSWYQVDAIDDAQEHLAIHITERALTRVAGLHAPLTRLGRAAVLGCAEGCRHTIGLRMVSDILQCRGWNCLFVGGDTPKQCFLNILDQHHPALVMIGCSSAAERDPTLELLRSLKAAKTRKNPFAIGVGGTAVRQDPTSFLKIGADFVLTCLREFERDLLPGLESKVV